MGPALAFGAPSAPAQPKHPLRMAFFYVPNGMFLPNFHPATDGGSSFALTPMEHWRV